MEIFICFEVILLFLTFSRYDKNKVFLLCCILLFILTGLHDGQEKCDFPQYMNFFTGKCSIYGSMDAPNQYDLEVPYLVFCNVLSIFGRYNYIYILGTCFMFGIPIMLFAKKNSENIALSLFLLLTLFRGQTYLMYLAAHRQMIGIAFMLIAILIYNSNCNKKIIYSVACLLVALISHSTSYFVIPTLCAIRFVWQGMISKKMMIAICLVSVFGGIIFSHYWSSTLENVFLGLDGIDNISRTTQYLNYNIYELSSSATILNLLPLTSLTCIMIFFSKAEELKSFYLKCITVATVIYNLLSIVPLVNRAITIFILLGVFGGIPSAINKQIMCKQSFFVVMLINLYLAISWYLSDDFRLQFNFIWE